jgi:ATP-dependent 26S proteasome regulatory subunit
LAELAAQAMRLSGAELEQVVTAALYAAFAESREISETDLESAIHDTVPLYDTYEERIKELRDWAKGRTRPASIDAKIVELFAET